MNIENITEKYLEGLEEDSDLIRKMTGRLSKKDSALRLSNSSISAILRLIHEYDKKLISGDEFAKMAMGYRKDLITAVKLIAKAK